MIKVKPIKFTKKVMPICLPFSDKFPDEKGNVYVAGINLYLERCLKTILKFIEQVGVLNTIMSVQQVNMGQILMQSASFLSHFKIRL